LIFPKSQEAKIKSLYLKFKKSETLLNNDRGGTWRQIWEGLNAGESNGKLPLRTCPGCSVSEPYQSPDCALVLVKPAQGLNTH